MAIPAELEEVLSQDPDILHGELCFAETRVPLAVLFDNFEEGMGVNEFVQEYPSVTREQALAILGWQQRQSRRVFGLR